VSLDPKKTDSNGVNFVSHAHSDHIPSKNGGTILTSIETSEIANLRGFKMENHVQNIDNFSLIDSGHILGAKGLLFDDIFYTGDICTRDRGFLKGGIIPKCKTLITECTFGLPEFVFPKLDVIQKQVNELISELYGKGVPVILLGYQLGKAQTITQLFGHWGPLYFHDSVKQMNTLHQKLGIPLNDGIGHSEAEKNGLLNKKPWIMIAPLMSEKNQFLKDMKSKYGAVTIGFSGWAQSSRFAFGRRSDYSIPMSDHCDFNELVDVVIRSGAEQVYTIHGFVEEFAAHLRKLGISAQPLRENSLDDFT
jgi:putative mRNA 3-end processing factor